MWDEMKIKQNLIFDKHNCELLGFVDCGEMNSHLDFLEHHSIDADRNIATYMLLFYVRGIFSHLEFPYAHFPTKGAAADQLFSIVWEAVYNLELSGFRVVAFACDGASANRKFFRMHGSTSRNSPVFKTANIYSDDPSQEIYFFSDVPHLVKTTRNCFANSFAHSGTRALWVKCIILAVRLLYFVIAHIAYTI